MTNTLGSEWLKITQGKRAFFENLLAAVFFSVTAFALAATIFYGLVAPDLAKFTEFLQSFCGIGLMSLALGLRYAAVKTILFSPNESKLITRFEEGPFKYDSISKDRVAEYVAVYRNPQDEYEVNLWFAGNKKCGMFVFESPADAFQLATQTARKLKIDLLDATVKGASVWVNASES